MDGKLRNMASVYLMDGEKILYLYRMGSRVVSDSYVGTAGGHFEKEELNDARACVLRELYEESGLLEEDIQDLSLRYITLRLINNEIRQNYYFFANLKNPKMAINSNEGVLERFDRNESSSLEMPFTSRYVIDHFTKIGINTNFLYGGIATSRGIDFVEMSEF